MCIEYRKVSDFNRGILYALLADAYAFNPAIEKECAARWRANEDFFFDNLQIADKYCFITVRNNEPIGFIAWDPRNMPEYAEIGDNCIVSKHKGCGYGRLQLQEAINRIKQYDVKKIIVTTNSDLIPAQRNYESVGFKESRRRKAECLWGDYVDYVICLS